MTIQLPVLLWTVICFVLLMLILSRLLFRPLLGGVSQQEEYDQLTPVIISPDQSGAAEIIDADDGGQVVPLTDDGAANATGHGTDSSGALFHTSSDSFPGLLP